MNDLSASLWQVNADKFKLVSKPQQDDLGTKTMAAYLLSGGKTNKNVLWKQIQQVILKESAIL